jgi:hypothetical protein
MNAGVAGHAATRRLFRNSHSKKKAHRPVWTVGLNTHQKSGITANFRNSEQYPTGCHITTARIENNRRAIRDQVAMSTSPARPVSHCREAPVAVERAGHSLLTPHSRRP